MTLSDTQRPKEQESEEEGAIVSAGDVRRDGESFKQKMKIALVLQR